jgi:hypothetical protein
VRSLPHSQRFSNIIFWWMRSDLNREPHTYKVCALTKLELHIQTFTPPNSGPLDNLPLA